RFSRDWSSDVCSSDLMSGRRLIDLHLSGGTYNFGHRNPELVAVLKSALDYFDMGNHWFPSVARAAFAEKLVKSAPGMKYAIFGRSEERRVGKERRTRA